MPKINLGDRLDNSMQHAVEQQIQDSQENVEKHLTGFKRDVSTCEPGDTMKRLKKVKKSARNGDLSSVGLKKKKR